MRELSDAWPVERVERGLVWGEDFFKVNILICFKTHFFFFEFCFCFLFFSLSFFFVKYSVEFFYCFCLFVSGRVGGLGGTFCL